MVRIHFLLIHSERKKPIKVRWRHTLMYLQLLSRKGKKHVLKVNMYNLHFCFSFRFLVPTLSSLTSTVADTKRRWTPFADLVSSTVPSRSADSSVSLNTTGIQANPSSTSLTNAVKSAMSTGQLTVPSTQPRRPTSGITLSSKDLNHLSPQSM